MYDVSVMVCTYNRAESLRETLTSLIGQSAHGLPWEIVVVDNNSSDGTPDVVLEAMKASPVPVRYLFEGRQGLSFARNRGIREAKGKILAFTDDDVIVDPNWLRSLLICFSETRAGLVAGKIERLWLAPRPEWLLDEISAPLLIQDMGSERMKWKNKNRHCVGANMAFHRDVFEKVGDFRVELGRRGSSLIGGEDREIFQRVFEARFPIYYEPKAVVRHKVEAERLSQNYFRRWFHDIGRTLGHGMNGRWTHHLTLLPLWAWKDAVNAVLRFGVSRLPGIQEAERFASECWFRFHSGVFQERLSHWLPFGWGKGKCVFKKDNE